MKIKTIFASALVLTATMAAIPAHAQAATQKGSKAAEVRDELKELKAAVKTFHKARQAQDKAGEKAALQTIQTIWQELPAKIKDRILKNHPELAKRIENITK